MKLIILSTRSSYLNAFMNYYPNGSGILERQVGTYLEINLPINDVLT